MYVSEYSYIRDTGWLYDINAKTASFVQLFNDFFFHFSFYYYRFEETKNSVKYDKLGSVQIRFLASNWMSFCFQWQEKMRKKHNIMSKLAARFVKGDLVSFWSSTLFDKYMHCSKFSTLHLSLFSYFPKVMFISNVCHFH